MARPKKFRKYTPVEIEALIRNSDKALYNALLALYKCQSMDEQSEGRSKYYNRKGFAKPDAKMLTALSKAVQDDGSLNFENKEALRNKLAGRYINQITRICNKDWDDRQVTLV